MPWQSLYPLRSLRNALRFNAAFSFLCALTLLLAPAAVANLLGDVPVILCQILGAGLLLFALDVIWVASRKPISSALARLITWADIAWVVATPVMMVAGRDYLSFWGQILLMDVALVTAFCAWNQWRLLRITLPATA